MDETKSDISQLIASISNGKIDESKMIAERLAKKRACLSIRPEEVHDVQDDLLLVFLESFEEVLDTPFILNYNKRTTLKELKEKLSDISGISGEYQNWFHEDALLKDDDKTVMKSLPAIKENPQLFVYVAKNPIINEKRFRTTQKYQAWLCDFCSSPNNANYVACSQCSKSRINEEVI